MGKLDELVASGDRRWRPTDDDYAKIDAARHLHPPILWADILAALREDNPDKELPSESVLRSAWKNWRNQRARR